MKINILYEDEFVLALDKPSGLLVHRDGRNTGEALTDWINANYPGLKEVGETEILQNGEVIKRPGIVHRLDKDTSGLILIAKTQDSYEFLKKQFQDRKIEKIYNAVVHGKFGDEKLEGTIDFSIGRSANDFRKWIAKTGSASVQGITREAITHYKVITQGIPSGSSPAGGEYFAYVELRPKTGRTHQIRVHMKAGGHPVVMDKLYGPKTSQEKETLGFKRLALHALSIKLELPNGTHINIESPLPEEFENAKSLLKNV